MVTNPTVFKDATVTVMLIFYLTPFSFLNRSLMQPIAQATLMMCLHLQGKISPKTYIVWRLKALIIYRDYKFCFISLFRADIIDYGNAFNLTKYLINETNYIVWDRVASSITYVRDMLLGNATLYQRFQVSIRLILLYSAVHFQKSYHL